MHGASERGDVRFGDPPPAQPDDVEPSDSRAVSLHDDERGNIALARGRCRHERALTDAHVLGDAAEPAERAPILADRMPRELNGVRAGAMRPDRNVVRNVRAHHEQVVIADARRPSFGAAVGRHVLAKHVVHADFDARGALDVALGLRLAADDRKRVHRVACSQEGWPSDDGVCAKDAPRAKDDARLDDRIGTYDDVVRKLGSPVDDGRLVHSGHRVTPRDR